MHQLSVAADGVLSIGVAGRVWVLPGSRGLWIPAGCPHTVDAVGAATMTTLWFDPTCCPVRWVEPTVVTVDPLLRNLVARLDDADLDPAARRRSEAVLFDLLSPVAARVLDLPMPTDDRARRVAEELLAEPRDRRTLAEWGRGVGASDRTLARGFISGTGLTFHEWRTRVRILAAMRQLADGCPVTVVATNVGYATSSAFGAAFRRIMGTTPSTFLEATTTA